MKKCPLLLLLLFSLGAYGGDTIASTTLHNKPFVLSGQKDLPLLCAGIASAGAAFFAERSIAPLTIEKVNGLSRNAVNCFDRNATYHYSKSIGKASDISVYCILAAPLSLFTDSKIRETAKTFLVMYTETVMLAYALPSLGKGIFKRPRPYVYNPAVPLNEKLSPEACVSFFSRHTTFAFASACFMSTVYGSYNKGSDLTPFIWAGSLAAASAVGIFRFAAGAHFPTDILTGVLAGTLVGCGVPYVHKTINDFTRLSLTSSGNGLCLSLKW
jgi:membrane-associated phospholipid phosphatase